MLVFLTFVSGFVELIQLRAPARLPACQLEIGDPYRGEDLTQADSLSLCGVVVVVVACWLGLDYFDWCE